jgi:hypothetical protein
MVFARPVLKPEVVPEAKRRPIDLFTFEHRNDSFDFVQYLGLFSITATLYEGRLATKSRPRFEF